jgi:hypothetical protein
MNEEKKKSVKENIEDLQSKLNSTLGLIDDPSELLPDKDILPNLNMSDVQVFDYEKQLESIKIDAKETLNCIANLYLDDETMRDKNVNIIIKDDSLKIAELNYSIFVSKRALNLLMNQIDMGTTNPELYKSVFEAQKEMRETIKAAHDLLNVKMKNFYMELKNELDSINTGDELKEDDKNLNIIGDPKKFNKILEDNTKENIEKDFNGYENKNE